MNKEEALYNFYNSFGISAYPNIAPANAKFPFIVYENNIGEIQGAGINVALNIYYYTDSEALPNAKVEEIANKIGLGGIIIHHDQGAIWIQRGNPIYVSSVGEDATIKHRQMNLNLLFM